MPPPRIPTDRPGDTSRGRYDVIVVLGTRVGPDGQPSPALARRVARGASLFHEGLADRLILCGGLGRHPPAEAHVMRDLAVAAGVPETAIVLEEASRTTLENAVNAAGIMGERGWRDALLVTDALHLPRSLLAFRVVGVRARGRSAGRPWRGPFPSLWRFAAYELAALPWYVGQLTIGRHRGRDGMRGGSG